MGLDRLSANVAEVLGSGLGPNEHVVEVIPGSLGTALMLTDSRLHLRYRRGVLQSLTQAAWDRSDVESVTSRFGVLEVRVRVPVDGKTSTERHTITFDRNPDVWELVDRVQRIMRGEPAVLEPTETPLDPKFESALASAMAPGESQQFRVPDRHGSGGIVVTDAAVYFWDAGLRRSVMRRWPLWAIAQVSSIAGGRQLALAIRDAEVSGRPLSSHAFLQRDKAATSEFAEAVSLYVESHVGLPESDASIDAELTDVTESWQVPVVVRRYTENDPGHERLRRDTVALGRHGYAPIGQLYEKGRVRTGELLVTGGAGAAVRFAAGKGAVRKIGVLNVTFAKTRDTFRGE